MSALSPPSPVPAPVPLDPRTGTFMARAWTAVPTLLWPRAQQSLVSFYGDRQSKVSIYTTGHQNLPKIGQNSIISSYFARRAKKAFAEGRSPPQELEVGPRSRPYLLVN